MAALPRGTSRFRTTATPWNTGTSRSGKRRRSRVLPTRLPNFRSHLTLALATMLHLFTHAYGTMLVPLYLLVRADLHLGGVKAVALIVTVYGIAYSSLSFAAGVLADRHDRRMLLGIGLLGNAIAITLMGFTHQYALLLGLSAMAGAFGALFHPTANALVPAHH